MLGNLRGVLRVDHAQVRLHNNVRNPAILLLRIVEQQLQRVTGINLLCMDRLLVLLQDIRVHVRQG